MFKLMLLISSKVLNSENFETDDVDYRKTKLFRLKSIFAPGQHAHFFCINLHYWLGGLKWTRIKLRKFSFFEREQRYLQPWRVMIPLWQKHALFPLPMSLRLVSQNALLVQHLLLCSILPPGMFPWFNVIYVLHFWSFQLLWISCYFLG